MKSHKTIILHWKGPFTYDELEKDKLMKFGVYLATGKLKNKQTEEIQYCGITEGSFFKRIKNHHKVHEINREQKFWLASDAYSKKTKRSRLEIAESIIIYFWQPSLNERKKAYSPSPVTVVNYWFKKNGEPRLRQHSLCKDLDDVLSWDGRFWRTGNLSVWEDY